MNHLESSFTGKNSFWRYLVMFAAGISCSNTIGALPLLIGSAISSQYQIRRYFHSFAANPNDLSVLGFSSNTLLIMMLFPFIAGLAAFILLVKPLHSRTIRLSLTAHGK